MCHRVTLINLFGEEMLYRFPKWSDVLHPCHNAQDLEFLCILTTTSFLVRAIIAGVKGYLLTVLICIFLMTNDLKHLFVCSLATAACFCK